MAPFLMPRKGGGNLTEKQKRFADEYLIDLNATRAAYIFDEGETGCKS